MAHDPISDLKRYAAALEAQVPGDRARAAARSALHTPSPARTPRRAIVAIVTTVVMGISNVALATVADPAVPGDALYGLDRAYERVGSLVGLSDINAGERASEFLVLQERGKSTEALELVQETLTKLLEADDPEAAVQEFTEGLGNNPEFADAVRQALMTARTVDTKGAIVSEMAREIVESIQLPDHARGNPGGPENPGPPADRGPATTPTPPENPGPPADRGPATSPTPPSNPGQGNPGTGSTGQNGGPP